jgi:hypothetical protein
MKPAVVWAEWDGPDDKYFAGVTKLLLAAACLKGVM